jgi:hypothetical protein
MKFDIIGDIHGHAEPLRELLGKLGYSEENGHYKHSEPERKAIFVGDFIDRGPQIRETLSIVKSMVENGAAYAVLGNHEYNALCFHTTKAGHPDSWLRSRSDKNTFQHIETLCQFKDHQDEWKKYLAWFMTLPLFLEIENFRVVHAAWIPFEIEKIKRWTSKNHQLTDDLLQRSAIKKSKEFKAIETVLKGVEIPLPEGQTFCDKDKNPRKEIRIRWWEPAENKTYRQMAFPANSKDISEKPIDRDSAANSPVYDEPVPVFFGHYWLAKSKPEIQNKDICCLDYSIANKCITTDKRLLVAYCWQGEEKLANNHFKWVKIKCNR